MATGIDLMRKLRSARSNAQAAYERSSTELLQAQRQIEQLRGDLYGTLEELAKHQVISLANGDMAVWSSARAKLEKAVQAREGRYTTLLSDLETANITLSEREAAVAEVEDELADAEGALRAVELQVSAEIEGSPAIRALRDQVAEARRKAQRAQDKAQAARLERDTKLKPYVTDPVFSYLLTIGYGTPQYSGRGLTRVGDSALAALCRFVDARFNFTSLNQLPVFLERHATSMTEAVVPLETRYDGEVTKLEAALGVERARAVVKAAATKLERCHERLDASSRRVDGLAAEKESFHQWADPAFVKARADMRAVLEQAPLDELERFALATTTTQDDALVGAVGRLRVELRGWLEKQEALRQLMEQKREASQRADDLVTRAKQKGWDSSNYRHRESGFDDLLNGYILGTVLNADAWRGIEQSVTKHVSPSVSYGSRDNDWGGGKGGWSTTNTIGGGSGGWSTTDVI